MQPAHPVETGADRQRPRWGLRGYFVRYASSSVVATILSQTTFLILYGPMHASPTTSTALGWMAGAVPNYWLNRAWTWQRRGRPSLSREVVPYLAIVLTTLLLATVATNVADAQLVERVSEAVRVGLVSATFLGVYGFVFLLKFFLLDRLFAHLADRTASTDEPVATKESV
jgi:putative flippase GtrA